MSVNCQCFTDVSCIQLYLLFMAAPNDVHIRPCAGRAAAESVPQLPRRFLPVWPQLLVVDHSNHCVPRQGRMEVYLQEPAGQLYAAVARTPQVWEGQDSRISTHLVQLCF